MDAATRQAHLDHIAEHGYTIVPTVLDEGERAALLDELDRLHTLLGTVPAANDFEGTRTRRVYNLLVHGRLWEELATQPDVLGIVEGVLDPGCLMSSLSSIAIGPGESAQPIHADDQLIPLDKPHVAVICNTMWALTDFTEANGATRIIPGSHLADASPDFGRHYDSVPAEMAAGSVLIWHGSLWHGGGSNTTADETRVGVASNYCAGYLRQQENQQLGIPRSIARGFSPRLRELVGYSIYHGLIGHIDKHHPAELLDVDTDERLVWDYATSEDP